MNNKPILEAVYYIILPPELQANSEDYNLNSDLFWGNHCFEEDSFKISNFDDLQSALRPTLARIALWLSAIPGDKSLGFAVVQVQILKFTE